MAGNHTATARIVSHFTGLKRTCATKTHRCWAKSPANRHLIIKIAHWNELAKVELLYNFCILQRILKQNSLWQNLLKHPHTERRRCLQFRGATGKRQQRIRRRKETCRKGCFLYWVASNLRLLTQPLHMQLIRLAKDYSFGSFDCGEPEMFVWDFTRKGSVRFSPCVDPISVARCCRFARVWWVVRILFSCRRNIPAWSCRLR